MFNLGYFNKCTDLYINCDGASDNIAYTVLYTIVHLLTCARSKGWPLRRIHLLRFKVGHTHNALDATFGVLSRHVYGKLSLGQSKMDILSFDHFKQICRNVML